MLLYKPDKSEAGSEFCLSWPVRLQPSCGTCGTAFSHRTERRLSRQRLRLKARSGRNDFLPVEAQGSLSFLFRLRNEPSFAQNHSCFLSGSRQIYSEPTDVLRDKSAVCGLNGLRPTLRVGALHLNPRPRSALLLLRPLSVGRFASLRFRPKNMAHHIFQLESELQNIPEAAPEASPKLLRL